MHTTQQQLTPTFAAYATPPPQPFVEVELDSLVDTSTALFAHHEQAPTLSSEEICPPTSTPPLQASFTAILEGTEEAQSQHQYEEDFSEDASGGPAQQQDELMNSCMADAQLDGGPAIMAQLSTEDSEHFMVVSATKEEPEKDAQSASEFQISRPTFVAASGPNKLSVLNGSDELLAMRAELNRMMEDTDTLLAPAQADVA